MTTGWIKQKRRYRQYKARTERLPESYRTAIAALQRYSYYFGHGTADGGLSMLEDLVGLFEQGAASATPVREIVGEDPVEFAEAFLQNYPRRSVDRPRTGPADSRHRARCGRGRWKRRDIPMTTQPVQAIHVEGLEKSYKKVQVLRGVDFDVAQGSIFALLGSNGAGKTTVVKILSTLLKPDSGTATVDGFDVVKQPANVRESISLTGQFAAVDEILSGRENLVLVARLRHLKAPGRIADDLLERFALTDAGERKVSTYSGGMRRRLDIAMSLIGNPHVIFLDEPTTGLDPQGRIEVWQAVKELAESGTTVLLTTQYLDEAEQLADQIAILHGGRIIVNGTLAELKQLLPPARVEYVEKQPTLEDVFFAIVGDDGKSNDATGSARTSEDQP